MVKEKRKVIGVCGSRIFNQIPMQFINILRKECVEKGYYVIAFSSNDYTGEENEETIGEQQLFELTRYIDFAGLVILTETLKNPKLLQKIVEIGHSKNIPVFSVDGELKGCCNMVMDYHDGFEQMVRHVVEEHGCRRVNMVAGFRNNEPSDERIAVYKRILQENGIPFEEERLAYGDFWDRPTRKAVKKFLEADIEFPEAIVCANDSMAVAVCSVLNENGYSVPEDVIVTGFDGTKDGKYHFPRLTTCEPDYESAVSFLLDRIEQLQNTEDKQFVEETRTINFAIQKRQSCGCQRMEVYGINTVISNLSKDVGDCAWHNIAMSQMVSSLLDSRDIMDIAARIPEYINLWSDNFRFACLKSDLIHEYKLTDDCTEMVTILWDYKGEFEEPGEHFSITEFMPRLDEVMKKNGDFDTLVVRLLNSGRKVYGYIIEGMQDLDDRRLQRCNEFAMFLTVSIDTTLHNYHMHRMNENLSRAYHKISNLYIQDPMTRIYNRIGFSKKLNEWIEMEENVGKYLYIVSIDMDGLKYINDTFGHSEGDFAITALSKALIKVSGKDAICSRFGGDEFTCGLMDEQPEQYSAEEFARQLMACLEKISGVKAKPYCITASVGMTYSQVEKDMDIEVMLKQADRLMYDNKVARKKQRQ